MRKPRNESELKQKVRRVFLTNPLFIYKTANGKILTRDATRVLVCLLRDIDDMTYWGYDIQKNFIDSYLKDTMTNVEIFSSLEYLEELRLIKNLSGTPENYIFNLTHEGMHFFELRRKKFVYLLANSVFLPIITAIATTIITLLISGLV